MADGGRAAFSWVAIPNKLERVALLALGVTLIAIIVWACKKQK